MTFTPVRTRSHTGYARPRLWASFPGSVPMGPVTGRPDCVAGQSRPGAVIQILKKSRRPQRRTLPRWRRRIANTSGRTARAALKTTFERTVIAAGRRGAADRCHQQRRPPTVVAAPFFLGALVPDWRAGVRVCPEAPGWPVREFRRPRPAPAAGQVPVAFETHVGRQAEPGPVGPVEEPDHVRQGHLVTTVRSVGRAKAGRGACASARRTARRSYSQSRRRKMM
jgi:hypothetical protein